MVATSDSPREINYGRWILLIFSAGVVGLFLSVLTFGGNRTYFPIHADAGRSDVGAVWVDRNFSHQILIHNDSELRIRGAKVIADCSCTSITPDRLDIPASSSAKVTVHVDLLRAAPRALQEGLAPLSMALCVVDSKGQAVSRPFQLSGTVKSPIVVPTASLAFPAGTLIEGREVSPLDVPISRTQPDTRLTVMCNSPVAHAEFVEAGEAGFHATHLRVSLLQSLAAGPVDIPLVLSASIGSGPTILLPISISGYVLSDIYVKPAILSALRRPTEKSTMASLVVASRTSRRINVIDLKFIPSDGSLSCADHRISTAPGYPGGALVQVSLIGPTSGSGHGRIGIKVADNSVANLDEGSWVWADVVVSAPVIPSGS